MYLYDLTENPFVFIFSIVLSCVAPNNLHIMFAFNLSWETLSKSERDLGGICVDEN